MTVCAFSEFVNQLADAVGADNPWYIYRCAYKYTDCGPSIGFLIRGVPADHKCRQGASWRKGTDDVWLYCDSLGDLGTFADMEQAGFEIVGVSLSSIVEGSDVEIDGVQFVAGEDSPTMDDWYKALDDINKEASFYWERDNCDWFWLLGPEDDIGFHIGWDGIEWDCAKPDDEKVVQALEKWYKDGANTTWDQNVGMQTHKDGEWFDVPGLPGWQLQQWCNDATY